MATPVAMVPPNRKLNPTAVLVTTTSPSGRCTASTIAASVHPAAGAAAPSFVRVPRPPSQHIRNVTTIAAGTPTGNPATDLAKWKHSSSPTTTTETQLRTRRC